MHESMRVCGAVNKRVRLHVCLSKGLSNWGGGVCVNVCVCVRACACVRERERKRERERTRVVLGGGLAELPHWRPSDETR